MSGGHFDLYAGGDTIVEALDGQWHDMELDEMWRDLFMSGEFSVRGYGGLFQTLDFALSGDTDIDSYRDAAKRFKRKWMGRTDVDRAEFYRQRLQEECDRMKEEL